MQRYVIQLLSDIQSAERPNATDLFHPVDFSEDSIAEVEAYVYGDELQLSTFKEHCGLQPAIFPPADQLNGSELEAIVEAFTKMTETWHLLPVIPESVPAKLVYPLLINLLDYQVNIMEHGFVGIEFCSYEPSECPFGEAYCSCKSSFDEPML